MTIRTCFASSVEWHNRSVYLVDDPPIQRVHDGTIVQYRLRESIMTDLFSSFTLAAAVTTLTGHHELLSDADAIEFRMDRATAPLEQLAAYDGDLPIIATNRATWEGGNAPEPDRLTDLATAATLEPVAAIDLEYQSIRDGSAKTTVETAADADVAVIASIHDFADTPSKPTLITQLRDAAAAGDVGKLAVTATSPMDVLSLLAATDEVHRNGGRVATMAMGAIGRHSRIIAPIYGSRIGYAPIDSAEATAPGQFDLSTMRSLIDAIVDPAVD